MAEFFRSSFVAVAFDLVQKKVAGVVTGETGKRKHIPTVWRRVWHLFPKTQSMLISCIVLFS